MSQALIADRPENPASVARSPSAGRVDSRLKIAILTTMIFMWEGVIPSVLLGLPAHYGKYLVGLVIILHLPAWILGILREKKTATLFLFSALLMSYYIFVSFVSSSFIFDYSAMDWIGAQYILTAMLLPIALFTWRVRMSEVAKAIFLAGVIAATAIFAVHTFDLYEPFREFARRSVFEQGYTRIVFLKNEIAFATVYLFFGMIYKYIDIKIIAPKILMFILLFYTIYFSMDSRLALAAVGIAIPLGLLVFKAPISKKLFVSITGSLAAALVLPEIYARYVGNITSGSYLDVANVRVRLNEVEYFMRYFKETNGLGYGLLSVDPESQNHAAWATWRMIQGYNGFGVQDLGVLGSLVQFGYVGFAATLVLTGWCILRFYRLGRLEGHPDRLVGIAGFSLMLAFMISPWPMDFFTLNWTILLGWGLVYLAWLAGMEAGLYGPGPRQREPRWDFGIPRSRSPSRCSGE